MSPTELAFPSVDGLRIFGHLSLPAGNTPYPAVIVVCGGRGGAKDANGRYMKVEEHRQLVPHGFAVFTIDPRGSLGHGVCFASQQDLGGGDLQDVIAGAQFLMTRKDIIQILPFID